MRRLLSSALLAACGLFLAGTVSAAPLGSASFSFQIGTLPAASFPGSGATGTATSNTSASLDAGSAFAGQFTTSIPTSAAPPLTYIQVIVTKNAGGTFTGATPNKVGGVHSITGTANVYGIGGFPGGGSPLLAIPLNVGSPNTVTKAAGGVAITAIAAGWTVATAVVDGLAPPTDPPGATTTTATAMGANGLAPDGSGTLVLVTPIKILTNVAGTLAAFGVLSLTYVPEPGTLMLLGLGVAGLAAIGRRRS
jgi:hypothetical protein